MIVVLKMATDFKSLKMGFVFEFQETLQKEDHILAPIFDLESGEAFVGTECKVTSCTSVQTRATGVYKNVTYTIFLILTKE